MNITLKREIFKDKCTIGKLYLNDKYFCDTLEDKYRDLTKEVKVPGQTAIPYGTYKIVLNESPRFKRVLPRLIDVPQFSGVLIHRGNKAEDTEGCILVGKYDNNIMVLNSADTEKRLLTTLQDLPKSEDITLTIK